MAWEIVFISGTICLGAALVYGLVQYRRRNPANDPVTEAATREEYDHPERYARRTRKELKDKLRPSR